MEVGLFGWRGDVSVLEQIVHFEWRKGLFGWRGDVSVLEQIVRFEWSWVCLVGEEMCQF